MSIFHFRAVLKGKNEEGRYRYTFYPDHVMAPEVTGIFLVNPDSFAAEITEPADAEEKGLVSTDRQAVLGLMAKIKDYFDERGEFPEEVFRIS